MSTKSYHVGERNKNLAGRKMVISEFRNADDIDVIFENNETVGGVTYRQFLTGSVLTDKDIEYCKKNGISLAGVMGNADTPDKYGENCPKDMDVVKWHRDQTFCDVVFKLLKYGKCAIIRPCGFGKTTIGIKLFSLFNKCLFLYPSSDPESRVNMISSLEKTADKNEIKKKVVCKSYHWLRSLKDEDILALNYDLVFMDEMHVIGGEKTNVAVQKLMMSHKDTYFVGATATPNRMDGIDVVGGIFDFITTYPYTLENAIEDGVIKRPYYSIHPYSVEEYIKDAGKRQKHIFTTDEMERIFEHDDIKKFDKNNLPKCIKEECEKVLPNTSYMKFVAFFWHIDELNERAEEVGQYFKKAFPGHEVYLHPFHSECLKNEDDMTGKDEKVILRQMEDISNLPKEKGRIDIILNCEKLTMGYHDDSLSGILMFRKTNSHLKFTQMIGRAFTCTSENPLLVFDIVDNLHRKAVFNRKNEVEVDTDFIDKMKKQEVSGNDEGYGKTTEPEDGTGNKNKDIDKSSEKKKKKKDTYKDIDKENKDSIKWDTEGGLNNNNNDISIKSANEIKNTSELTPEDFALLLFFKRMARIMEMKNRHVDLSSVKPQKSTDVPKQKRYDNRHRNIEDKNKGMSVEFDEAVETGEFEEQAGYQINFGKAPKPSEEDMEDTGKNENKDTNKNDNAVTGGNNSSKGDKSSKSGRKDAEKGKKKEDTPKNDGIGSNGIHVNDKKIEAVENNPEEDSSVGRYRAWYRSEGRCTLLDSKNVIMLNNEADIKEIIDKVVNEPTVALIKNTVRRYLAIDGCEWVDKEHPITNGSFQYKILKAQADINGCDVKSVISFMAENDRSVLSA